MSEVKENQWNKNFVNYIEENIFYKTDGKALRRGCDNALVDELKKDLETNKDLTILDFACGTGRLVSLLKENDIDIKKNYSGYDSSEAMIEKAMIKFSDLEFDFKEPNKNFDVVICLDMLQHLESKQEMIDYINRIVAKANRKVYFILWSGSGTSNIIDVYGSKFNEHFPSMFDIKFKLFENVKNNHNVSFQAFNDVPYPTVLITVEKVIKAPELKKAIKEKE